MIIDNKYDPLASTARRKRKELLFWAMPSLDVFGKFFV